MSRDLKNMFSMNEYLSFTDNMNEMAVKNFMFVKKIYSNPYKAPLPPKEKGKYNIDDTKTMLEGMAKYKSKNSCTIGEFDNAVKYAVRLGNEELAIHFIQVLLSENIKLKKDPNFDNITKFLKNRYDGSWDFLENQ